MFTEVLLTGGRPTGLEITRHTLTLIVQPPEGVRSAYVLALASSVVHPDISMGSVFVLDTQRESIRACVKAAGMVEVSTGLKGASGPPPRASYRGATRVGDE